MTQTPFTVNVCRGTLRQRRIIRIQWAVIGLLVVALVVALIYRAAASGPDPVAPEPQAIATTPTSAPAPLPTETIPPKPEPVLVSLGEFTLTAYCPCVKCCGVWSADHPSRAGTDYVQKTRSGTVPEEGRTIGVDPTVLPLGSTIYINDHAYVAEDTGNGVGGNHIDIFYQTHEAACAFGVQTAEVYILK